MIFEIDIFLGDYDFALINLLYILGGDTMMAKLLEPDSAVSCRVNFRLSGIQNSGPTLVLNHNYNFDWFSMSQRLSQLVCGGGGQFQSH